MFNRFSAGVVRALQTQRNGRVTTFPNRFFDMSSKRFCASKPTGETVAEAVSSKPKPTSPSSKPTAPSSKPSAPSSKPTAAGQKPQATAKSMLMASGAVAVVIGVGLGVWANQRNMTYGELLKALWETSSFYAEEALFNYKEWAYQNYGDTEPLLPDDPAPDHNLPCIVIEFDKVLGRWEHTSRAGWQFHWRPGADKLINDLTLQCEVVVWSDDHQGVAQGVWEKVHKLIMIPPTITGEFIREYRGQHVKDLTRLGRPIRRIIHIDHDAEHLAMQPENGILVREYDGNDADRELVHLRDALVEMVSEMRNKNKDAREVIESMGGGDADFARRHMVQRQAKEEKLQRVRGTAGKVFGGFNKKVVLPKQQ